MMKSMTEKSFYFFCTLEKFSIKPRLSLQSGKNYFELLNDKAMFLVIKP